MHGNNSPVEIDAKKINFISLFSGIFNTVPEELQIPSFTLSLQYASQLHVTFAHVCKIQLH